MSCDKTYCLLDINECLVSNECHPNATCENTNGNIICQCKIGFTGDGSSCLCQYMFELSNKIIQQYYIPSLCYAFSHISTDIDECEAGTVSCHTNAECTNTDGSYTCSCSSGFSGDGMSCVGK